MAYFESRPARYPSESNLNIIYGHFTVDLSPYIQLYLIYYV